MAGIVTALVSCLLVVARVFFHGPRLARFATGLINAQIQGKVVVETIEWPLSDLLFGGGVVRARARGIQVIDPWGERALEVPEATARIRWWRLVSPFGAHDVWVEDLVVDGAKATVREVVHPEDPRRSATGLLATFWSRRRVDSDRLRHAPGPIYELRNARLSNVELLLDFHAWRAHLLGVRVSRADVHHSSRRPAEPIFTFTTSGLHADDGHLWIYTSPDRTGYTPDFPLADIDAQEFAITPADLDRLTYRATARSKDGGAAVEARGFLDRIYAPFDDPVGGTVELFLDVKGAGALARRLSFGHVEGENLDFHGEITGPLRGVTYRVEASGATTRHAPFVIEEIEASLQNATGVGQVSRLVATGLGGRVGARGAFQLVTAPDPRTGRPRTVDVTFDADVETRAPVDVGPFLPEEVVRHARSSRLEGRVHVAGRPADLTVDRIDLRLGAAAVAGAVHVRKGVAHTRGLTVTIPGARATAAGQVDVLRRTLGLSIDATVSRLAPYLLRFGAPGGLAHSLDATGRIDGRWDDIAAEGTLTARGVPAAGALEANVRYRRGRLDVARLFGEPLGGELRGRGALVFGGGRADARLEDVHVAGNFLSLARLPVVGRLLAGTLSFQAQADGPAGAPRARLDAAADDLRLGGYWLGDGRAQLAFDGQDATIETFRVGGEGTGLVELSGRVGRDASVDLDVNVSRLPLATLPGIADDPTLRVGGHVSVGATVRGSLRHPEVQGQLTLAGVAVRDALLGRAEVKLEPWPGGRVLFTGKFFQNKFKVSGWVSLAPPWELEAVVEFHRFEIEELFPEVADFLDAHGWVTGNAHVRLGRDVYLKVTARQIAIDLQAEDDRGRPHPFPVRNRETLELVYEQGVFRLLRPVRFEGPSGEFTVRGHAGRETLDVGIDGKVNLELVEFFTRRYFDEARGNAQMNVRIAGTPQSWRLSGSVLLSGAAVRPRGRDAEVQLPSGRFVLSNDRVRAERVLVVVDKQRLTLDGEITFSGPPSYRPERVNGRLKGRVAAKLLEIVFGRWVSAGEGSAAVDLAFRGPAENPDIDGTLVFDGVQGRFEVAPRGLRRDIVFTGGRIKFTNQAIALKDVRGAIDDSPMRIAGSPYDCTPDGYCTVVRLYGWKPIDVYADLEVRGLSHRIPGLLETELDMDVLLSGDSDGLQLRGKVTIVDGRYVQDHAKVGDIFKPQRVRERHPPFWEGTPLLENAQLALTVETSGGFKVQNNLADLVLTVQRMSIEGTPRRPELDGEIRAEGGKLRLPPPARPWFRLTDGVVSFVRNRPIPDENPTIDFRAEAEYHDRDERVHIVYLAFEGTLGKFDWNLWTSTGFNKAQTLALIITGRSDANDLIRGDRQSSATTSPYGSLGGTSSVGGSSTFGSAADPVVKELAGDFVATFIEDPLRNALRLDCARVEPGIESIRLYGCLDVELGVIGKIRFEVDHEESYQGLRRTQAGGNMPVTDNISLDLYWLRDPPREENAEFENRGQARLKFRFRIP